MTTEVSRNPIASFALRQDAISVIGLGVRRGARLLAHRQPDQGAFDLLRGHRDRDHQRVRLRARRARLHARLRHPRADQLRPRRRVHARRHVLDLLRRPFLQPACRPGHRDRPDRRRRPCALDGLLRPDQRDDRVRRLPAATRGAATGAADHRDRDELHRAEHRPHLLGAELRHRRRTFSRTPTSSGSGTSTTRGTS